MEGSPVPYTMLPPRPGSVLARTGEFAEKSAARTGGGMAWRLMIGSVG
jgi:hypothetical protein